VRNTLVQDVCMDALLHACPWPRSILVLTIFLKCRIRSGVIKEDDMPKVLFASRPSSGAAIIKSIGSIA